MSAVLRPELNVTRPAALAQMNCDFIRCCLFHSPPYSLPSVQATEKMNRVLHARDGDDLMKHSQSEHTIDVD